MTTDELKRNAGPAVRQLVREHPGMGVIAIVFDTTTESMALVGNVPDRGHARAVLAMAHALLCEAGPVVEQPEPS